MKIYSLCQAPSSHTSVDPLLDALITEAITAAEDYILGSETSGVEASVIDAVELSSDENTDELLTLIMALNGNPGVGGYEIATLRRLFAPESVPASVPNGHVLTILHGPLGSGKSRHLLECLRYAETLKISGDRSPLLIKFDFNLEALPSGDQTVEQIESALEKLFADRIVARLRSAVGAVDELREWPQMLNEVAQGRIPRCAAVDQIELHISEEGVGNNVGALTEQLMELRSKCRTAIQENCTHWFQYAAILARYQTLKITHGCPGIIICVDNLDAHPPVPQTAAVRVLIRFGQLSGLRPFIALREVNLVTMRGRLGPAAATVTIDEQAHVGPNQLQYIRAKLSRCCRAVKKWPTNDHLLRRRLMDHLEHLLQSGLDEVVSSVEDLAGASLRMSQVLIPNVVVAAARRSPRNPQDSARNQDAQLRPRDLLREILLGGNDIFAWSPRSPVENLFQCYEDAAHSLPLVKGRVIAYLAASPGGSSRLDDLVECLSFFEYKAESVLAALADLTLDAKQLVLADREMQWSLKSLADHGITGIHITRLGRKYYDRWLSDLVYVETVCTDCDVRAVDLGKSIDPDADDDTVKIWDLERVEDRLDLSLSFICGLARKDCEESVAFRKARGIREYQAVFKTRRTLMERGVRAMAEALGRVIESPRLHVGDGGRRANLEKMVGTLEDWELRLGEVFAERVRA